MTSQHTPAPSTLWPIELPVQCAENIFRDAPLSFDRWAPINYLVGPNGSGKTTFFKAIMNAARMRWKNKVKILGTGRLSALEKSVAPFIGDPASRLFQDDNLQSVYSSLFSDQDTSHQAFQLLEKRLDLQIRVLGFLRQVFKRSIHLRQTRKGLQVLGVNDIAGEYQIVDECHGLKELITILTFLYDDTFSVLGIDEPELHLHPQFQRFLLDELRSIAGSPDLPGKKLIFLVTHSPILLDIRQLDDLTSIISFSGDGAPPTRATLSGLGAEHLLKIRQALPSFHAGQRELLFSATPILVEGPTDSAIVHNVAAKLGIRLGAAGIGLCTLGGKNQLFAFRAMMASLGKTKARFILDLDATLDSRTLNALDNEPSVIAHLNGAGGGGRTLSQESGELSTLVRSYLASQHALGNAVGPVAPGSENIGPKELGIVIRQLRLESKNRTATPQMSAILGKVDLLRSAARAANVHILADGPIEAYYQTPPAVDAGDFAKKSAMQAELDSVWESTDHASIELRYAEILDFIRGAGMMSISIGDMTREPIANLIHLLQTEIARERIKTVEEARKSSRLTSEGYWYICDLSNLVVESPTAFRGTIAIKDKLGGGSVDFNQDTRAYRAGRGARE